MIRKSKFDVMSLDKNIGIAINTEESIAVRTRALHDIFMLGKDYLNSSRKRLWEDDLRTFDPILEKIRGITWVLFKEKDNRIVYKTITELWNLCPNYFDVNTISMLGGKLLYAENNPKKYENLKSIDKSSLATVYLNEKKYQRYKKLHGLIKLKLAIVAVIKQQLHAMMSQPLFVSRGVERNTNIIKNKCPHRVKKICDFLFTEPFVYSYKENDELLKVVSDGKNNLAKKIEIFLYVFFQEFEELKIELNLKRYKGRVWSQEKIEREHRKCIKQYYGERKCQICGKIFGKKEHVSKDGSTALPSNLNLGAQWECLCGHIAELLYGKILRQACVARGKNRADIIVDDSSARFDKNGKIQYVNKIIEVKLSPLFLPTVRSSILKYIDQCDSLEIWSCTDIGQESLKSYLDEQLKYNEDGIERDKRGLGSASEGFHESEITQINKLKKVVGNKKVTLKGWDALLREVNKKQNSEEIIQVMKKIVGEYAYSIYKYNGKEKRYLSDRKAHEVTNIKFDEILKI